MTTNPNAATAVDVLTPAQKELYSAIYSGKDKPTIMREFGLSQSVFAAQCTRIKKKGVLLPDEFTPFATRSATRQDVASGRSPRPASTGPGSSEKVIDTASKGGPAIYDIENIIKSAQERGEIHGDMAVIHPMAIMGITIQFMRLCGGRLHAHQIIEDVYGAIRAFVGDAPSTEQIVENATKPFSGNQLSEEDLNQFLNKVEGVKEELQELIEKASGGISLQTAFGS